MVAYNRPILLFEGQPEKEIRETMKKANLTLLIGYLHNLDFEKAEKLLPEFVGIVPFSDVISACNRVAEDKRQSIRNFDANKIAEWPLRILKKSLLELNFEMIDFIDKDLSFKDKQRVMAEIAELSE
jgi:hypothetical protein